MRHFGAYVFAYLVTKAIYLLFSFHPFERFNFFIGLLIDLSIWIVLCYLFVFLFGKIFKAKTLENK